MAIDKINFSYPKGTLQSVFDNEALTALELAAKTSKKVDECVEIVNGVEQTAIEATAIVEDMYTIQNQFVTDNSDTRAQLVNDNQEYLDGLTASKTQFETELNASKTLFETNMSTAVNTIVENSETLIQNDVNTKIETLITDGTIETLINDSILQDVKQDIVDVEAKATSIDNKLKEVANLSDYCKGDGITDDTQGLISAINTGKKVIGVKGKTYLISSRITLIDNTHIDGNGAIFLSKPTNPTYNVNDNIFNGFQVENIIIENCILDGGNKAFPRDNGLDGFSGNSLIKIDYGKNITIKNCQWQNYSQVWGGSSDSFHVVTVLHSEYVNIFNCIQRDVYPEGLLIRDSSHVNLNGFTVDNLEASTVWSPLHLFYCDVVNIENIVLFGASAGSSMNFTCSNFSIKNAYIEGGAGFDMSNETETPYQVKNGVIDNLTLIGGQVYTHPVNGGCIENVSIINSLFKPIGKIPFRIDSPKNFTIKDCKIEASRTVENELLTLFQFDAYTVGSENVLIENIEFTGTIDRLINVNFTDQRFLKGIKVKNVRGALTSNGSSSYGGNGALITLRNPLSAEPNTYVDVTFENCDISNITGALFHVYDYGYFNKVEIINSKLAGANDRASLTPRNFNMVNSELKVKLLMSAALTVIEKLTMINNLIEGYNDSSNLIALNDSTYIIFKNITIKGNIIKDVNRFIDIRNETTHFDPASCIIDIPQDLIKSSSSGDGAILTSMKKDGVIGKQLLSIADITTNRIKDPEIGQSMYDTTLNKPIWCKTKATISLIDGSISTPAVWVDSTGTTV